MDVDYCDVCGSDVNDPESEGCENCSVTPPEYNEELNFNSDEYNPYDYIPDNLIEPSEEDT